MDEQDGTTAWVAGLDKVELYSPAASDSVVLHQHPPVMALAQIPPFHSYSPAPARIAGAKLEALNAANTRANFFRT